jgi:hypothetical protein
VRATGTKILITAVGLTLALAVGAPAQEPEVENVRTSVTIRVLSPKAAIGTLSATEKECEPKRAVILYAIVGGRKENKAFGKTRTDEQGDWVIREDLAADTTYYAIASGDRRGEFNCRDDRSSNRKLP